MKATMLKTMKAAAINSFGDVDVFSVQEVSVPEISAGEVLIHVQIAGIGVWDPLERQGYLHKVFGREPSFPHVIGSEGAGTIEDVGDNVAKFKEGDRVYAISLMNPKGGFYAQYAAVNADNVSHIPDDLTIEQAGVMPVDAITGLQGLDDNLNLKSGETVMIFGASGGIGHIAVQLAKRMGATVFAVASGNDGVALVKELGADVVVDGHKDDILAAAQKFAPDGIDAALVMAGGDLTDKALEAIRFNGRIAYPNGVHPVPEVRKDIKAKIYDGRANPETIEKLNDLIESGPFKVQVAKVFNLDQVAEAHRALDSHFLGKIGLRVE